MEALAYEGPDGELALHPSLGSIQAFFHLGADYWLGGSGSAYIGWIELRHPGYTTLFQRPVLHIFVHEPYGVCLSYEIVSYDPAASGIALMTCDETAPRDLLVKHFLGGEPACFPRASFVPKQQAERIVADFLQTQQPPSGAMWRPRRSVMYDGFSHGE